MYDTGTGTDVETLLALLNTAALLVLVPELLMYRIQVHGRLRLTSSQVRDDVFDYFGIHLLGEIGAGRSGTVRREDLRVDETRQLSCCLGSRHCDHEP